MIGAKFVQVRRSCSSWAFLSGSVQAFEMTRYLKGECVHCSGHIEFPAETAGLTADCPHCGKVTDLLLARPETSSGIPTRIVIWTAVTVALLLIAFVVALWQLKRVERWAENKRKA